MFIAFIKNLPVGELPNHSHSATTNTAGEHSHKYGGSYNGSDAYQRRDAGCPQDNKSWSTSVSGNHTHTVTINSTGSGQPHNNLQPYISVYMWKRTV